MLVPAIPNETLAAYLAAPKELRSRLQSSFLKALNEYALTEPSHALQILRFAYDPSADFSQQQSFYRSYLKIKQHLGAFLPPGFKSLRVALLGSGTLTQLACLLQLNLLGIGFLPEFYEGDYNVFRQEILNPESGLYEFKPQLLFLLTNHRDLEPIEDINASLELVQTRVRAEFEQWLALWTIFHKRSNALIIQNNFDIPDTRLFGNMESKLPGSTGFFLQQLNHHMTLNMPDFVLLHDLDYLSSYHGKKHFTDPRFYFHSKQVCSFEVLPSYASSLASVVRAQYGKASKCLVLDLDNTLWGGVIGDDGIHGIVIGEGSPQGEAYLAFQHYIKSLKERGVILAVCSKNDPEIARTPFLNHPDMVLRLEDIACFVANWNPKPDNLLYIAQQLNIGVDSLVFLDDNPAERAIVRETLREVVVPELPEDPALYLRTLSELRNFETVAFSYEDSQRTRFYIENSQRASLERQVTNVSEFLSALAMVATVKPFDEIDLDRVTQLVARSNQFNLTTKRYTHTELHELMLDPSYLTLSVRLRDKFGDNGLISVWIGKIYGDVLDIDTWLMSCRVLARGVEQHLLNTIVRSAKQRQLRSIKGHYIPTSKNKLVEEHYAKLGFSLVKRHPDGSSDWELSITSETPILETFITDETRA